MFLSLRFGLRRSEVPRRRRRNPWRAAATIKAPLDYAETLPNASAIVVERESQRFILLPNGNDDIDRPIA
ncbi:MAG TPA: hypothetical protein VN445_06755 [Rectinemataceae bacterium]|nr:hypothetical protein [Rectinemataceae bacterium]